MNYELPGPEWLGQNFGIHWDGKYHDLNGNFARVARIESKNNGGSFVVRISDPGCNPPDRMKGVHRFQTYLSTQGVRTVLPLKSLGDETFLTTDQGMTVEIYPFVQGRSPEKGNSTDIRLVGNEIGRLHSAGTGYVELGGEESLYQNHLALNRLMEEVLEKRESTRGMSFHRQYIEYVAETERWIEAIENLRPGLVETGLHLDTGPQNMIIDEEGQLWFIDCAHMVRGRRVFEVCVTLYYLDPCSDAPPGEPARYRSAVEKVETSFLAGYRETCDPSWSPEEEEALRIERMLMFIHGTTYWTARWDEETVLSEFTRWNEYYADLRAKLHKHL